MQLIDSIDNLREDLFRDKRVLIMGPNSLAAYLISIHMGFRTLALNERAGEIMQEFGKLKKEFEKFNSSSSICFVLLNEKSCKLATIPFCEKSFILTPKKV